MADSEGKELLSDLDVSGDDSLIAGPPAGNAALPESGKEGEGKKEGTKDLADVLFGSDDEVDEEDDLPVAPHRPQSAPAPAPVRAPAIEKEVKNILLIIDHYILTNAFSPCCLSLENFQIYFFNPFQALV